MARQISGESSAGRAISIRADHPVYRAYVAIRELMSLIFAAMLGLEGVTQQPGWELLWVVLAILDAIVAGERDPQALAAQRYPWIQVSSLCSGFSPGPGSLPRHRPGMRECLLFCR